MAGKRFRFTKRTCHFFLELQCTLECFDNGIGHDGTVMQSSRLLVMIAVAHTGGDRLPAPQFDIVENDSTLIIFAVARHVLVRHIIQQAAGLIRLGGEYSFYLFAFSDELGNTVHPPVGTLLAGGDAVRSNDK